MSLPAYTVDGHASNQEREEMLALAKIAYDTIFSQEFVGNLHSLGSRYPSVFARPKLPDVGMDYVVEHVATSNPKGRYVDVVFDLSRDSSGQFGDDFTGTTNRGRGAVVFVGAHVLDDFRSDDVVRKSCAVHTIAHELSHTISISKPGLRMAFEDTSWGEAEIRGRNGARTPVASYLVGSVAQCTYLRRAGRIPDWGVQDCVEVFGVRAFNSRRCGYFSHGEPVQLRAELPPPAEGF